MALYLNASGGLVLGPNGGLAQTEAGEVLDPPTALSITPTNPSVNDEITSGTKIADVELTGGTPEGTGTYSVATDPTAGGNGLTMVKTGDGTTAELRAARNFTASDIISSQPYSIEYSGEQGSGTLSAGGNLTVTDADAEVTLATVAIHENGTTARTNQPFSFAFTAAEGDFDPSTQYIKLYEADGSTPISNYQQSLYVTDIDSNGRVVRVDGVKPSLSSGGTPNIIAKAATGSAPTGTALDADDIAAVSQVAFTVEVESDYGDPGNYTTYTAELTAGCDTTKTAATLDDGHLIGTWHSGPAATNVVCTSPFKDASNNPLGTKHARMLWSITAFQCGGGVTKGWVDPQFTNSNYSGAWAGAVSCRAVRIKDASGSTIQEWTVAGGTMGVGYITEFNEQILPRVYFASDSSKVDDVEMVHATDGSGVLQSLVDTKHFFPHYLTGTAVDSQITTWKASIDGDNALFGSLGAHNTADQGATGNHGIDLAVITGLQVLALRHWSNADARYITFEQARISSQVDYQGYIDSSTGVICGMQFSDSFFHHPNTSGVGNTYPTATEQPNHADMDHMPHDFFVPALLTLDYIWVRQCARLVSHGYTHAGTQSQDWGKPWLVAGGSTPQARGRAWNLRSVVAFLGVMPDGVSRSLIGISKTDIQGALNYQMGVGSNENLDGVWHYTTAENLCWDASQTGAISPSGLFDNDDPNAFIGIYGTQNQTNNVTTAAGSGQTVYSVKPWMDDYMASGLCLGTILNVFNADGAAFAQWHSQMQYRFLSHGASDWCGDEFDSMMPYALVSGGTPQTVTMSEALRFAGQQPGSESASGGLILYTYFGGAHTDNLGITGFQLSWSGTDTSAVTVTVLGASPVAYFEDETHHTSGLGTFISVPGLAAGGAIAKGRCTACAPDGLSATFNFQSGQNVVDIDTATFSSPQTPTWGSTFRLSPPSGSESWITQDNQFIASAGNDMIGYRHGAIHMQKFAGLWQGNDTEFNTFDLRWRQRLVAVGSWTDVSTPVVGDELTEWMMKAS